MTTTSFAARLAQVTALSNDTSAFRFEALEGTPFATASAGGHLDVHLGPDLLRQYSLWDWDPDGRWASVAVKREDDGRGGSAAMHRLAEGEQITITGPRNAFTLNEDASHHLLIAGGIGVTPLFAMARTLTAKGKTPRVLYLTRNPEMAAFLPLLQDLPLGDQLTVSYSDTEGMTDFAALFKTLPAGTEVYVCGPEPMLQTILDAAPLLPDGHVKFERFAPVVLEIEGEDRAFTVELDRTGQTFEVPADKSLLDVLLDADVDVDFGCSEGVCGACITDVISGEIDHRDGILDDGEKEAGDCMCVCVSRAKGDKLVLDL
ncbi:PDR/VanB family oxidoreductase [Rhodovibrionaceae bacterium A322]